MEEKRLQQIKVIFVEAMERSGFEREAYIAQACGSDTSLKAEVESLLSAANRIGDFLVSPTRGSSPSGATGLSEGPGTTIGRYKLLELIGEGGFGLVFMAEQEFPVRRKVALKIIKFGMDTKQVIARFEAERQALAMMEHPNISRVFDAGATETGRPYFVMELVRGIPITEYGDREKLNMRQRVELFVEVCRAIQHAHQKGIIHRDIKPSNVLVTHQDGKAVPKIIDFGIAKAIEQRLTEKTLFTEFRQFVGTPVYMSPEQAQMSAVDIDTRSDIYSLGVLLYELLTGATPFDSKMLRSAGYDEICRIIREVEPPKPSTRLASLGATLSTVAERRQIKPAGLLQGMKSELDWIVMKCLEKDRARRYETANSLALDIGRFLDNEPVEAAPPSASYRLRRFVRRYHRELRIVALVSFLLAATAVLSIWQAVRADRSEVTALAAQQTAQAAETQAKIESVRSNQVAAFLESILNGMDVNVSQGRDTTILREILETTEKRLNDELVDQPDVRAELYSTIGHVYFTMRDPKAQELDRKALELQRSVFKTDNRAIALSLFRLANDLQGSDESMSLARESMEMYQRLEGPSHNTVNATDLLGQLYNVVGKPQTGEPYIRRALSMRNTLGDGSSRQYAGNLYELGLSLCGQGKWEEGIAASRQAIELDQKILSRNDRSFVWMYRAFACNLQMVGELDAAFPYAADATSIELYINPSRPPMVSASYEVGIENDRGNYQEAERLAHDLSDFLKKRPAAYTDYGWTPLSLRFLAEIRANEGQYSEAESLLRKALDFSNHASPKDDSGAALASTMLGKTLAAEQQYEEADAMLRSALEMRLKLTDDECPLALCRTNLANLLSDRGRYAEADVLYRDALKALSPSLPAGNVAREWCTSCYAASLLREGKLAEAEPLFREAVCAEKDVQHGRSSQAQLSVDGLCDLLIRTGRETEAAAIQHDFHFTAATTHPATARPLSVTPSPSEFAFNETHP